MKVKKFYTADDLAAQIKGRLKYLIYGMFDGVIICLCIHSTGHYKTLFIKPFKTWTTIELISVIPVWPFPPFFVVTLSLLGFYFMWRFNFYMPPNKTLNLKGAI